MRPMGKRIGLIFGPTLFLTVITFPTNAIIFASGHVIAIKVARAGLTLDLIGIAVVSLMSIVLVLLVWK